MKLNRIQLEKKVHSAVFDLIKEKNYVAPVDVLIRMAVLTDKDHKEWRFGRIPYLEKACNINLGKLSFVMKEIRAFAKHIGLRESFTVYNRWGVKGKSIPLRFSKSGDSRIEKAYSTHFVKYRTDDP